MGSKDYLLTYELGDSTDYAWFDSEEEMDEFIDENEGLKIIDALYIIDAVNIK